MNSPVMQAIGGVRAAEQAQVWQRNESTMLAVLQRQFGERPMKWSPAKDTAQSAFLHWCDIKGVRSFPAAPAAIAQFALENAVLGIDVISEVVDHIAEFHEFQGAANPVATWIVAEAMDSIGGEVDAPHSWPKEQKWRFTQLPCLLRRYLSAADKRQQREIHRALNEAAAARKAKSEERREDQQVDDRAH